MPKNNFGFATPAQCGVQYERINAFLDEVEMRRIMLHGFAFLRGDNIFAEGYYAPIHKDFLHRMYSTSKSYTSMAIGALIAEGKVCLDDPVWKYFPDKKPDDLHPYIAEATVRNLLMMSTPFDRLTYGRYVPDWEYSFFHYHPVIRPGTRFKYDTCATYMLDCIIERVTGKPFLDYLRDVALREVGFSEEAFCIQSPDHRSWGGSGVIATLRDTVRLATLVKNRGVAHGKQLLPADYIDEATSDLIDNSNEFPDITVTQGRGYGYQIWQTADNGFAFTGMGAQCAIILPEKDFVAVFYGDTQGEPDYDGIFDLIKKHISDHIGNSYEENPAAQKALQERLSKLKVPVPAGDSHSPTAELVNRKEYSLFINPMQIQSLHFEFYGDRGVLKYKTLRGDKEIPFGMANNVTFKFPEKHYYDYQINIPSNRELHAFASAVWVKENELMLRVYVIDNNLGNLKAYFTFDGDKISVRMSKVAEWFMDEYEGVACGICQA